MSTSNDTPPLSVPVSDNKEINNNDFFWNKFRIRGGNIDFKTHDKPKAAPPTPTQNEDPEEDKPCHHGRGPSKRYPGPFWKRDKNNRF